jgi:hypothetical protein
MRLKWPKKVYSVYIKMDIHDSENNLGEINNSSETLNNQITNSDANLAEMNPYADNSAGIHDEISHDNITVKIEDNIRPEMNGSNVDKTKINILKAIYYAAYQKQVKQKQIINQRRNDIMRSIAKQRYSTNRKSNVKRLISTNPNGKRIHGPVNASYINDKIDIEKHRRDMVRCKANYTPAKSNNIKTAHSYGNHIRDKTPVNDTSSVLPDQISHEPINANLVVSGMFPITPVPGNYYFGKETVQPIAEKPKEVNLAEIVTGILQDVLTGKITNIDNVIGKLRVDYEEKNMFTNIKKRNIILLNFEDDTMRPVLKIEDKYIDIIKNWYNDCDLILDIEETNVSIPENITLQDVSGVLFEDINYKYKDEYLYNYIPIVINKLISKRTIKELERKYFFKPNKETCIIVNKSQIKNFMDLKNMDDITCMKSNNKLKELGIEIPNNIEPNLLNNENKNIATCNNHMIPIPGSIQRIDPEILTKKYTLNNPHIQERDVDILIEPYNSQNGFDIMIRDKEGKDIPGCYNNKYDCLNIEFADNSQEYDISSEDDKKNKTECIYVLINDKFLQTLTIKNPDQSIAYILKNHPEFGFVKLFNFSTGNNDIINFIEREFNKATFNDSEEVNKKILVTSQYIDFANKQNDSNILASSEENQVKKFLNSKYTINDDVNNKMKASTLYDIIINSKAVKIENDKVAGFRTRLSKYLKDLGLQKKRYNDGFYYYGIVDKEQHFNECYEYKKLDIDYCYEIYRKREEELKTYHNTRLF